MTKGLKKFLKGLPNQDELKRIWEEMAKDGARGTVVLAVALIDDILKDTIKHRMVALTDEEQDALFAGTGPVATFSARIRIAYALGIIGKKTRHDLDTMRELRNAMAHGKRAIDFDTPEVLNIFKGLHCLRDITDVGDYPPKRLFVTASKIMMIFLLSKIRDLPAEMEGHPVVHITQLD